MPDSALQVNTLAIDALCKDGICFRQIRDSLDWGVGAIKPQPEHAGEGAQRMLVQAVSDSLEEVAETEKAYSSCTDGRLPVKLLSGEPVPVREQIVGTDTIQFFHMAEVLGARFYKNPDAPLAERIQAVVDFMHENGLQPSTHIACGAAAGYVSIIENLVTFTREAPFIDRQRMLLPADVYDEVIRHKITAGYQDRLKRGLYDGWSDQLITDAVQRTGGERAIAELNDDGRGVHGHVEEMIIRIQVDGLAINEAKVASLTRGREVFGVNDLRMRRNAELLGRGQDEDYRMALMAAEDLTDGGHGTLASFLPTYVIRAQV